MCVYVSIGASCLSIRFVCRARMIVVRIRRWNFTIAIRTVSFFSVLIVEGSNVLLHMTGTGNLIITVPIRLMAFAGCPNTWITPRQKRVTASASLATDIIIRTRFLRKENSPLRSKRTILTATRTTLARLFLLRVQSRALLLLLLSLKRTLLRCSPAAVDFQFQF